MRIDELRKIHRAEPFRAFSIRVVDGNEYKVVHPEFLAISKNGRVAVVFTPDDEMEIIDTALIASIHHANGRKSQSRDR